MGVLSGFSCSWLLVVPIAGSNYGLRRAMAITRGSARLTLCHSQFPHFNDGLGRNSVTDAPKQHTRR